MVSRLYYFAFLSIKKHLINIDVSKDIQNNAYGPSLLQSILGIEKYVPILLSESLLEWVCRAIRIHEGV